MGLIRLRPVRVRTRHPEWPPGPQINLPLAVLNQFIPIAEPFDPLVWGCELARLYGDLAHYRIGPLRVYQISHPDLVRQVLVDQAELYHKARLLKDAFRPFAGDGLLTSDGSFWRQQRRLIQPAFTPRQLATYGDRMVANSLRQAATWRDGAAVDLQHEMAALTLAIVVETLFGGDVTDEAGTVGALMLAVLEAANRRLNSPVRWPAWLPTPRHAREQRALGRLDAILERLIRNRRATTEPGHDLLSTLLAATDDGGAGGMSDRQLRDEMMTLFLAGHETTATAMTWIWYLLGRYPDVQARLHEELDRVLAGRCPTAEDLARLPYTEMVVREALRLFPPAPGVVREPVVDVELGGYPVRKGSLISVNFYVMHRDPRFFAEPERFDPERFSEGWMDRVPRYAYVPFGAGPRVCVGNGFAMMEARLILATLAQQWTFALQRPEPARPVQMVTLRPEHGLLVTVRARHRGV